MYFYDDFSYDCEKKRHHFVGIIAPILVIIIVVFRGAILVTGSHSLQILWTLIFYRISNRCYLCMSSDSQQG